jgi:hypothetical protein
MEKYVILKVEKGREKDMIMNNGKGRDERARRDIEKIQISNFKLKEEWKGGGILSSCRSLFEEEGVRFSVQSEIGTLFTIFLLNPFNASGKKLVTVGL